MTTTQSSNIFPKLRLRAYAPIQDRETGESRYWKTFSGYKEETLLGTPVSIHFHPTYGNSYLITHSTKVSLYHSNNDKLQRSYSRFTEDAFSGRFRRDGKLLVAGERSGYIKVFNVKTKSALRQIQAHSAAVHSVGWSSDGLSIISSSDDKKVKRWDLGTEELVWQSIKACNQHVDYVRALDISPVHPTSFVSGSYDHTIRIWDSRQMDPIHVLDHEHPVDYCLISPSGALVMSAGGNKVKVWDMLSGGRLLHTFSNHQKNITGLSMNSSGSKLLSCGLDGFVKVYSMETLQVVHGMKYAGPCISISLAPDNSKLLVGLVDGTLVIRNRNRNNEYDDDEDDREEGSDDNDDNDDDNEGEESNGKDIGIGKERKSRGPLKRQRRFYKGAGAATPNKEEGLIESDRPAKLKPYEIHLQKFNYQQALDASLNTRNPVVVVTVLEELCRRNGLTIALSGRDEATLEPLLSFVTKYVSNPRYARLVTQVTHAILDIYAPIIGQSDAIDELFLKLQQQVKLEIGFQKQVSKVMNALDGVINISSSGSSISVKDNDVDVDDEKNNNNNNNNNNNDNTQNPV